MQIPQSICELVATGPLAHLTTVIPDGSPEVTVVWVGIDNDEFVACRRCPSETSDRRTGRYLQEHNLSRSILLCHGKQSPAMPPARGMRL